MAVKNKKEHLRRCVGCGNSFDPKGMLRVVRLPDGSVIPDLSGKANGRGAYICRNEECLNRAMKNRGLERSLKTKIPENVREELRRALKQ